MILCDKKYINLVNRLNVVCRFSSVIFHLFLHSLKMQRMFLLVVFACCFEWTEAPLQYSRMYLIYIASDVWLHCDACFCMKKNDGQIFTELQNKNTIQRATWKNAEFTHNFSFKLKMQFGKQHYRQRWPQRAHIQATTGTVVQCTQCTSHSA